MNHDFPPALIEFYETNKNGKNNIHTTFLSAQDDANCSYYKIKFDIDVEKMLNECKSIDDLYFNHRSQDKKKGYGHRGWQSITLHGIDKHKTEHYTKYGFNTLDEANYMWTDAADLVPTLASFIKSLPYSKFDRVRIMKLAPGGYIMPHIDGKQRTFSPLNIAINNPDGCNFVFKNNGIVPFEAGTGFILDVATEHIVINNSDQARYHVIVHGHYSTDFFKY